MTNERRNQRDLFEQATVPPELSSDLRTALTPLLRVLLTEAAAQSVQAEMGDRIGEDDGDDQDHA
jgi:hypothetical protein